MFKQIVKLTAIVNAAIAIRDRNAFHALGYDYVGSLEGGVSRLLCD